METHETLPLVSAEMNDLVEDCVDDDTDLDGSYDSDDICEVYENQEMYDNMFALGGLSVLVGWYPGSRWSKKYLNQWEPLDEERQAVEAIEGRFKELSNEYGSTSSVKTAEIRKDTLGWIRGMVPTLGLSLDIPGVVESGIRKNHFKGLDVNRDGRIDKEEFQAAFYAWH